MKYDLLLDFDRPKEGPPPDSAETHQRIVRLMDRAGYRVAAWSWEEATTGWHAKVSLDPTPKTPMEIVALQAIAGSDPSREACNVSRARAAMGFPAYIARTMLDYSKDLRLPNFVEDNLREIARGPDSFWLDRWNVLYQPNPRRRHDV